MTQEEKELLMKDLCARLPYGVKLKKNYGDNAIVELCGVDVDRNTVNICDYRGKSITSCEIDNPLFIAMVKSRYLPYLFPMSSMTEEQKQEYTYIVNYISPDDTDNWKEGEFIYVEQLTQLMHFYHINHLDYMGLIPMGLANDATGLNIY